MEIVIEKLKGIERLVFEVPTKGIHLITGNNGCGKSTLLTCLSALAEPANLRSFISQKWDSADGKGEGYIGAKVSFREGEIAFSYQFKKKNWASDPKEKPNNLKIPKVVLVQAAGNRIFKQEEGLRPNDIESAPAEIINGLAEIFQSNKFEKLAFSKAGSQKGRQSKEPKAPKRGKIGFFLNSETDAYSEHAFSLGEISLLNLLYEIHEAQEKTLLLIDEMELSLHPQVQIRLFDYLEKRAKEKKLTVLLTTHSATLIKKAKTSYLLHKDNDGKVKVKTKASAGEVLREVADHHDFAPDVVMLTEDVYGKVLLEAMISCYRQWKSSESFPIYRIVPIAGWSQTIGVIRPLKEYLLPTATVVAFLDADVKADPASLQKEIKKHQFGDREEGYRDLENKIFFLPIVPEVGLVDFYLGEGLTRAEKTLMEEFPNLSLRLSGILDAVKIAFPIDAKSGSDAPKRKFNKMLDLIAQDLGMSAESILPELARIWCEDHLSLDHNMDELKRVFGKVFSMARI